jgi:hypothetical protein
MCGKFGLLRHLYDPVPAANAVDVAQEQADCCVRSWIFRFVANPVLDKAMDDTIQTARQLWFAIEALFQVNKASRAIFLSHEFHSMTQGDYSIDEYCLCVKTTADKPHDIGRPVSESTLVFSYARDQLILKELRLTNGQKVVAGTALLAISSSSCGGSGCQLSGDGQ